MNGLGLASAVQIYVAAVFFPLWVIVVRADASRQKILTRYLLYGAGGVAVGYAVMLAATALGPALGLVDYPFWIFYRAALTNVFLCGAAAAALWWFGVWPAGDAKLFMLLGALYPLTRLAGGEDYRHLFLSVLINIFLPASAAVFVRAGAYVFRTRLVHRRRFLMQLGRRKELSFLVDSLRDAAAAGWGKARRLPQLARAAAADPRPALSRAGVWILNVAAMSLFSFYLRGFFTSPILFTVFWGGIFLFWRRLSVVLGSVASRAIVAAACAGLLLARPPEHWIDLLSIFGNISFFSFFFYVGVQWTLSLSTGSVDSAYASVLLLPLLGAGFGLAASWLGSHAAAASVHLLLVLAGMGVFFGLSLVMVRLWDQEVTPSHFKSVSTYSVLAPAFVERLRLDEVFFEKHFSRLYPDGLTRAQARALQAWCKREGVETIPLIPTISFGFWIFLGFFLTWLLNGAQILGVTG